MEHITTRDIDFTRSVADRHDSRRFGPALPGRPVKEPGATYRPGRFPCFLPAAAAAASGAAAGDAAGFFPVVPVGSAAALRLRLGSAAAVAAARGDRAARQAATKASRVRGAPSAATTLSGRLLRGARARARVQVSSSGGSGEEVGADGR